MTVRGDFQALGMREARENWRSVVQRAMEGQPILILRDSRPSAVVLRFAEVEHWRRVQENLAALHGLEIYPELAHGDAELTAVVLGTEHPSDRAIRGLAREHRDVLGALRTMAVSDVPRRFAALLDEVGSGRLMTILVKGKPEVSLIAPREYDRLRDLIPTVNWFGTAGLDLAATEPDEIVRWVTAFRQRPAAASEAQGA
jgi:antitoxin (DNA-binding transcriptional repressor) of toxin-antitoxin stability system